ncbi:ABC transporter permease [Paenibacillus sp. NFR01]|uniref:ABC transporter permease n=1 Tax=Paenibacillus sp. NFR01 TaxID=1566279 RepID=UPI0008BA4B61|nr:ABC transporter permease [Paenibacillus sp. NFR01]SEU14954.1 ABC-2 type transport system permease protein [Paenibacillus sp. NFR01]
MNIWTIMLFELRRVARSRTFLLNMILLPLVLIFILGASLSKVVGVADDAAEIERVKVAIVNEPSSAMITAFLHNPEVKEAVTPQAVDNRSEAVSGLRAGKYDYAVIVPNGFDAEVQGGSQAKLEFILGKSAEHNRVAGTVFDNLLSTLNYRQAAAIALGPEVLAASTASVEEQPPVKNGQLSEDGGTYSASQFYAASMLLMFLLYSGLTVTQSLFSEKENHTLTRISSMPVKGSHLFIGKMLGVGLITVAQCAAIVLLSRGLFGVYWGNRPGLLTVFCLLMIIASMTFSILVCMLTKSLSSANTIINTFTVAMTFISGGMAPLPDSWVNSVGAFTVNHWVLQAMIRMMLHSGLGQLLPNLLIMSAICLVLFSAAIFSYRKVGYHG